MILLVSYDLKVPGRDYTTLYDTIKSAPGWWHYLESTWVISTVETPEVWAKRLHNVMDENDRLIVIDITGMPRYGWLPSKAWEWFKNHER